MTGTARSEGSPHGLAARLRAAGALRELVELALHAAVAALVFRSVLPWLADSILPDPLDPRFNLAVLRWGAARMGEGFVGVWSAPWLHPTPLALALSDHLLGLVPLFWGLERLCGSETTAYGLLLLGSFALTGWGTSHLLRRVGARTWIAFLLGVAVAYAPWRIDQLPHLQMLWAPALPWVLWAFDRLLARPVPRRAVTFVALYLLAVSAGGYLALLVHLPLAAIAVARLLGSRRRLLTGPAARRLAATALTCAALAVPFFLPYVVARAELGLERRPAEIRRYAATAASWLAPAARSGYARLAPAGWVEPERALFPGFLLGGAALLGAWGWRVRRGRRWAPLERGLLAAGALAAALAHAPVFVAAARIVPGLDGLRVPTRAQPFVLLALALLAARGLEAVARRRRAWARLGGIALAALALAPELLPAPLPERERIRIERRQELPDHLRLLAERPEARGVAVLPIVGGAAETARMLRAAVHGRPIVNGHSGYEPWTLRAARRACRYPAAMLDTACLATLRSLAVTHLVVEDRDFRAPAGGDEIGPRFGSIVPPALAGELELQVADDEALLIALRPVASAKLPGRP